MAKYNYVDWPGLKHYHQRVTELINATFEGSLRFGGEYAAADLPSPDTPDVNTLYRVTDELMVAPNNTWFVEGMRNKKYLAGAVLIVNADAVYELFMSSNSEGSYSIEEFEELLDTRIEELNITELQTNITTVTETVSKIEKSYVSEEAITQLVEDKVSDVVTEGVTVGAITYGEF